MVKSTPVLACGRCEEFHEGDCGLTRRKFFFFGAAVAATLIVSPRVDLIDPAWAYFYGAARRGGKSIAFAEQVYKVDIAEVPTYSSRIMRIPLQLDKRWVKPVGPG